MRGEGVYMNITLEQRKKAFDKFTNGEIFEDTINQIVHNKMTYYNWLKEYLVDNQKYNTSLGYVLNYVYHCMIMDNYDKKYSNVNSVVYFIRNEYNGLLKIGKTSNLSRRIKEIEKCFSFLGLDTQKLKLEAISYCPYGMNNGQVETYYHHMFEQYRKQGEWFDLDYELLINSLNIDYVINDILVIVEDIIDFPKGVKKLQLAEKDEETLKKEIYNELCDKFKKDFGIFEPDWFFTSNNKTSSKELYEYITSLDSSEETNLENKILRTIKSILEYFKEVV